VKSRAESWTKDTRKIARQASAGDVGHGVQVRSDRQDLFDVDSGGCEGDFTQRCAQATGIFVPPPAGLLDDASHQRVSIAVYARARKSDESVSDLDSTAVDDLVSLDSSDREPSEIVMSGCIHPRHLGGLAAQECTTRLFTAFCDALDDFGGLVHR
jgi:hypothetical protein